MGPTVLDTLFTLTLSQVVILVLKIKIVKPCSNIQKALVLTACICIGETLISLLKIWLLLNTFFSPNKNANILDVAKKPIK